jgi:glycosyltransferase involved in cell wall biosynthesis
MATFNGARFINEQLDSIYNQTYSNWKLIIRDDSSTDNTIAILKSYQKTWGSNKLIIKKGKRLGFAQNFLKLACDKKIKGDFFAFCDQDDVWLPNKLDVAINALKKKNAKNILLYGGRTFCTDESLKIRGLTPLFTQAPSFQNAFVQNIASGNTMVFNKNTKTLFEQVGIRNILSHDWWTYLLVTGVGGCVTYDPKPYVLYRQHNTNLIGGENSLMLKLLRFKKMINGQLRAGTTLHLESLESVSRILKPSVCCILSRFKKARCKHLLARLYILKLNGFYRQTWQGNISLVLAVLLNRL